MVNSNLIKLHYVSHNSNITIIINISQIVKKTEIYLIK